MAAPVHLAIVTLGCAKNEVDSEAMRTRLAAAGYLLVDDPLNTDCVIVNTCAFIQAATEESLDTIFDIARDASDATRIVVAGCLPSRYGDELSAELGEADAFVTCAKEDDIAEVLDNLFPNRAVVEACEVEAEKDERASYRYVKISDGCNRFCSFCTIPYIRGRYRSYPYETIRAEVASHIENGVGEIDLIAQDTGRWGCDFEQSERLADLLRKLAEEFPSTWFRVMYVQPDGVDDELLTVMNEHSNICSYLDMPIQHCSSHLLASMNRPSDEEALESLIRHIRASVEDISLRTTVMVGYPGETDDDFEALAAFLERVEFDYVGIFEYSPEEGTRAEQLPDQVDEATKHERYQVLRDLCDAISSARIAENEGKVLEVLIDGYDEDGQRYGRTQGQAPEVDGITFIGDTEKTGIVSVMIEDTLFYDMEGTLV